MNHLHLRGILFFPLLLLALNASPLVAQDTAPVTSDSRATEYVPTWYAMFTNIPGNWMRYAQSTFSSESTPGIIGMSVLTGGLFAVDEETWRMSDRWYKGSSTVRGVSDFFEYLGDGRPQFGLAAGFALYGFAAGDHRALRTASQTVEAILSCGVVIQALKHLTGRESPFVSTRTGGRWLFFPNQIDYHKHVPHYDAYPSGHIATALATVTVVAENYPELTWVRPVGYVIVGLIGVSMANTGIHWYSDYPLGLAIGYSFGMLAAHPERTDGTTGESGKAKISVGPLLTQQSAGVWVNISF